MYKLHGQTTENFLGIWMRNFQGIVFIWTQTSGEIFKSAFENVPLSNAKFVIVRYWVINKNVKDWFLELRRNQVFLNFWK